MSIFTKKRITKADLYKQYDYEYSSGRVNNRDFRRDIMTNEVLARIGITPVRWNRAKRFSYHESQAILNEIKADFPEETKTTTPS